MSDDTTTTPTPVSALPTTDEVMAPKPGAGPADDAIVSAPVNTAPAVPKADEPAAMPEVKTDASDTVTSAPSAASDSMSVPVKQSDVLPPISAMDTAPAEADAAAPKTDAAPVVVTPDEVKDDVSEHQKLSEEIEILTGEIQALQAKIERLGGGSAASATAMTPPPVVETPKMPEAVIADLPAVAEKTDLPPADLPPKAPTFDPAPPVPSHSSPMSSFDPGSTINDIYPKKDDSKKPDHAELGKKAETVTTGDEEPSVMGMIGEVVGVIGIVLLVLMLLSPLYKEMLGVTLWESLRSLGWLSTVGALLVGFLLSLFAKGKTTLKIILFIFLVIGGLMYYGISMPGSFLDAFLGSVLSFYQ